MVRCRHCICAVDARQCCTRSNGIISQMNMFRTNIIFTFFTLFLILFCDATSLECKQLTACSCIFPDGQGYNLTNLLEERNPLKVKNKTHVFHFQPCKNARIEIANVNKTDCNKGDGVSLCMEVLDQGTIKHQAFNYGTVNETTMQLRTGKSEEIVLIIRHGNHTTSIGAVCCNDCDTSFTLENKTVHPNLYLMSPSACKVRLVTKSMSIGSTLVILLVIFSAIYFVGGAIALKCLRGATGWEMLPNHEFWCEMPSLVRDGIVFTFNCCRGDTYQRI